MHERGSWDAASEAYAPFEAFTSQFTRAAATELPSFLPGGSGQRIMDVAAGTGASTFAMCKALAEHCRQEHSKVTVVATDLSEAMLKNLMGKFSAPSEDEEVTATQAAAKEGILELSSQVADAQDLSAFADGSFSALTCAFGIMFPPSPEKAVREFWRLLKPGGAAIVTTWHYNNGPAEIMSDLAREFKGLERFGFEELPAMAALMKFGSESHMRRLFRGDLDGGPPLWRTSDLQVKFVSGSAVCLPRHMAFMLNKNPVPAALGHWDEAAAEKYLQDHWTEDGQVTLKGTALILIARKPLG